MTYSEYKESGIDWVEECPSHWEVVQPKHKLNRVTRPVDDDDEVVTCFRDGVVTLRKNRREDGFTHSLKEHGYQQIRPGDLVVHEMDGFAGAIGISDSKGKSTPVYTVIEPDDRNDLRYLSYLLREMSKTGKIASLARSIRERTTDFRWNMWSVIHFPFPPIDEQQQIANFLEHKTQQVDSLIEKTQQKIELLKEQRTALINQVITKGLDPDAEMKDSGVEWIGEIPAGWSILPLKYVCKHNQNSLSSNTCPDYELDYIEISDVNSNGIIQNPTHLQFSKSPSRCRRVVKKNDIIISTVRTYLKSIGFIEEDVSDLICSTGFCVITANVDLYIPKILFYMFRANWFISNVVSNSEGVSYPSIQSERLVDFKVLLPTIQEQQEIIEFIDQKMQQIDSDVEKETKRIELLKEYRNALISEVVTGKIDVREEMVA